MPIKGISVVTFYNYPTKIGYYALYDHQSNTYFSKCIFKNTTAGENVIAFLGTIKAIKVANQVSIPVSIYCTNYYVEKWIGQNFCGSRTKDPSVCALILKANEYLKIRGLGKVTIEYLPF